MKFFNQYTNKPTTKGEFNSKPSLTVPNQVISIPEMIQRYAKGLPLGGSKVPIFEDENEDILNGVNWKTLDISEQYEVLKQAKREYDDINQRVKNSRQKPKTNEKPDENENNPL